MDNVNLLVEFNMERSKHYSTNAREGHVVEASAYSFGTPMKLRSTGWPYSWPGDRLESWLIRFSDPSMNPLR